MRELLAVGRALALIGEVAVQPAGRVEREERLPDPGALASPGLERRDVRPGRAAIRAAPLDERGAAVRRRCDIADEQERACRVGAERLREFVQERLPELRRGMAGAGQRVAQGRARRPAGAVTPAATATAIVRAVAASIATLARSGRCTSDCIVDLRFSLGGASGAECVAPTSLRRPRCRPRRNAAARGRR